MFMCDILDFEKYIFWEKLIQIALHFRVKNDFFEIPKQTRKNDKSDILFIYKKIVFFFLKKEAETINN